MTVLTQETTVEIFAADEWIDISSRCRAGHTHKFVLKHGYHGQAGVIPEPAECEIVTAQNDGYLWPDNPMSPLYGFLDLNTPMRVAFPLATTDFTTTVVNGWPVLSWAGDSLAATNNGLGGSILASDFQVNGGVGKHSVPTTSAYRQSIYYDVNLQDCKQGIDWRLPTSNVTGGDLEPANLIFRAGAEGYVQLRQVVKPDDTITLNFLATDETGSDLIGSDEVDTGLVNTGQWFRTIANIEDGRLQAKTYVRTEPEPFEWQHDDGEMLEFADNHGFMPYTVFAYNAGGIGVRTGVASGNTNAKPIEVEYDNWTVESVRFHGEISDYPMVVAPGVKDRYTPMRGAGILQRYTQGDQPTISALTRAMPFQPGIVAYWPLEDESGYFGSGLPGHPPMIPQRGTPGYGQFSTLKSSKSLPKGNGSDWIGNVNPYTFTGEVQIGLVVDLPTGGQPDFSIMCRWYTDHPSAKLWQLVYRTGGDLRIQAWNSEVDDVYSTSDMNANLDGGTWYIEIGMSNVGADVQFTVQCLALESEVSSTAFGTFTASGFQLAAVNRVWVNPNLQTTSAYGHVMVLSEISDAFDSLDLVDAMNAFNEDTISTRFKRVLRQNDIIGSVTRFIDASTVSFQFMGPQKPMSTLDILRQCVELDTGGVVYDGRTYPGMMLRRRTKLYNQTPKLVLDFAGGQIQAIEPKTNTRDVRNRVTVARIDGGSAIFEKTTGRKSTQSPGKGGSGKYETKVDVNASDDLLLQQLAAFRVAMVTANGARYPRITINLNSSAVAADPTITWFLLDLRPGDFVELTNMSELFSFDTVRLRVMGYTETITQIEHTFDLDCEPSDAFHIFEIEHNTLGRLVSDGSTLSAALNETDTSFEPDSPNDLWTTDPAAFPFDLTIDGEVMECTDITSLLPAYIATGTASHADNASCTPGIPGGATGAGDDMLMITQGRGSSPANQPADWTTVITSGGIRIFHKIHDGSESPPTVTWPAAAAGATRSAVITSWSDLGDLIASATAGGGGVQNIATPQLFGTIADGVVITVGVKADDWTTAATRTALGAVEIVDAPTTVGDDQGIVADYITHNGSSTGIPWIHVPSSQFVLTGGAASGFASLAMLFGNRQRIHVDRSKNNVTITHNIGAEIDVFRTGGLGV